MFPEDVAHKVGGQVQEALLAQSAQDGPVHTELVVVHVLQAELVHRPRQPLCNMAVCPLSGIYTWSREGMSGSLKRKCNKETYMDTHILKLEALVKYSS